MRKLVSKNMISFTLTLIRHGETKANKENVIQGQSDVPLSDAGIRQAQLLGQRLQNQKYSHVFASDLSRARETAQAILDKSNHVNEPIVQDLRLRERKFGDVEGKHVSELRKLASCANQVIPHYTPVGGETLQQVRERAILFFQDFCQLLRKENEENTGKTLEEMEAKNLSRNVGIKRRRQSDTCSLDSSLNSRLQSDEKLNVESKQSRIDIQEDEKPTDGGSGNKILKTTPLSSANGNEHNLQTDQDKITENAESQTSSNGSSASLLSVSPIAGHGKQNSTDDVDGSIVANVLIVSHGGLLKELIRHFVEDLGCILPPGSRLQAFKISPNTGVSKFTVTLYKEDKLPTVTCHSIHDDNHLMENGSNKKNLGI